MSLVHVRVTEKVAGRAGAIIIIDRQRGLLKVWPLRSRRLYVLPTSFVAEWVVAYVARQEAANALRPEKPRGRG